MTHDILTPLREKASHLRLEGRYKELIDHCLVLLDVGLEQKDHKSVLCAYINLAAGYYSIGAIEDAFFNVDAHLEYCSRFGDEDDKLNGLNILVILYDFNQEYTKAKNTLVRAIELGTRLKRWNMVSNSYSNYSHICAQEGNYEEALKNGRIGQSMADRVENSGLLKFRVDLNVANAYIGLGRLEEVYPMVEQMANDPILLTHRRERAQYYDLYGRLLAKDSNYSEAMKALDTAKLQAEDIQDLVLLKDIQEQRCEICEVTENRDSGYVIQQEYIQLLKTLQEQELALTALKLEVKHNIASIERNAQIDYLTGLYNRRHLEDVAGRWLEETAETKASVACVALDFDNFKAINDQYGHLAGDEALRQISSVIRSVLWTSDDTELLARYGGDEFVFVFTRNSVATALERMERLLSVLQDFKVSYLEDTIAITVSIGIADNAGGVFTKFSDLFYRADQALYASKANGKNQVNVFEHQLMKS